MLLFERQKSTFSYTNTSEYVFLLPPPNTTPDTTFLFTSLCFHVAMSPSLHLSSLCSFFPAPFCCRFTLLLLFVYYFSCLLPFSWLSGKSED